MNLFNWITSIFKSKPKKISKTSIPAIPAPEIYGKIENAELRKILKITCPYGSIYLSDLKYDLTSKDEIERFLWGDKTNEYTYKKEFMDCDDFSYRLMGNLSIPGWSSLAFGIAWSGKHAFNIFLDHKERLWIVEPQNDSVISSKQAEKLDMYKGIKLVIM
jgi:hypothetical protein